MSSFLTLNRLWPSIPPLATRMEEEPVGLMGRAQVRLLKEWPSIFGQAVRSTWESIMSSYQSRKKGHWSEDLLHCTAVIAKALGGDRPGHSWGLPVMLYSPTKGVGNCPWCQQRELEVKDSCSHCQCPWVLKSRDGSAVGAQTLKCLRTGPEMRLRPRDAAQIQRRAVACQSSKALILLMFPVSVSISNPSQDVSTTLATPSEALLWKKNYPYSGQQGPSGCQPALRALGLGHGMAEKPQRAECQSSLRVSGQPLLPGFQSAPCGGETGPRNHAGSGVPCLDATAGLSQSQALEGTEECLRTAL